MCLEAACQIIRYRVLPLPNSSPSVCHWNAEMSGVAKVINTSDHAAFIFQASKKQIYFLLYFQPAYCLITSDTERLSFWVISVNRLRKSG